MGTRSAFSKRDHSVSLLTLWVIWPCSASGRHGSMHGFLQLLRGPPETGDRNCRNSLLEDVQQPKSEQLQRQPQEPKKARRLAAKRRTAQKTSVCKLSLVCLVCQLDDFLLILATCRSLAESKTHLISDSKNHCALPHAYPNSPLSAPHSPHICICFDICFSIYILKVIRGALVHKICAWCPPISGTEAGN